MDSVRRAVFFANPPQGDGLSPREKYSHTLLWNACIHSERSAWQAWWAFLLCGFDRVVQGIEYAQMVCFGARTVAALL